MPAIDGLSSTDRKPTSAVNFVPRLDPTTRREPHYPWRAIHVLAAPCRRINEDVVPSRLRPALVEREVPPRSMWCATGDQDDMRRAYVNAVVSALTWVAP